MAYSKRGSRPIQVDRLTYRWRSHGEGALAVWHVLDAGLLRVLVPPGLAPGFHPTPAYVASAIREARRRGWQTDGHFELLLDHATFAMLAATRGSSQPNRVDDVGQALRAFDLGPLEGPLALRVVICISAYGAVALEASDTLVVHGYDWGLQSYQAPVDPDWLRDVLVDVRETDPTSSFAERSAGVWWVDPTGGRSWRGSVDDPLAQRAGAGLWRLGMRLLGPAGRRLIEPLHPMLALPETPWEVDEARRVVRLFGELRPDDGEAFLALLERTGWVVDATDLTAIDPTVRAALDQRRDLADVWVEPERRLERPWAKTVEVAREQVKTHVRQAMARRLVPHLDARWRDRALEALARGGALDELERWLGEGWRPASAPVHAAWFDGHVRWRRPERGPWLALHAQRLFVGLADGSVRTA